MLKRMTKLAYFLIIVIGFSCQKKDGTSTNDSITYEVLITVGTWSGGYFDETGAPTTVTQQPSGWTITFISKQYRPRVLYLYAVANTNGNPPTPKVTLNVYVNGSLVKSASDNIGTNLTYNLN